jgi:hypothetical protein
LGEEERVDPMSGNVGDTLDRQLRGGYFGNVAVFEYMNLRGSAVSI